MGVMKLLATIHAEGCPHAGLSRALHHTHLCAADILDFELAGRPGFDWDTPGGAYWPALIRWLKDTETRRTP